MRTVALTRESLYAARQMFDVVVDVERYADFVPYCTRSRLLSREKVDGVDVLHADLVVAYEPLLRTSYMSKITLGYDPLTVTVVQEKGPLRRLSGTWRFVPYPDAGGCVVTLSLGFGVDVASAFHPMMRFVTEGLVERFVAAFESRARVVYGPPPRRQSPPDPQTDPSPVGDA